MNTTYGSLKTTNLGEIIKDYINLLIKSEALHTKLEKLYCKLETSASKFIKNEILKLNNALNKIMVKLMEYQWKIDFLNLQIAC